MNPISLRNFNAVYNHVVDDLLAQWTPAMREESGALDIERYLREAAVRLYYAYRSCPGSARTICDIGGSFGAFPLALLRLGFDAAATRTIQYSAEAFDPLFDYIAGQGVRVLDYDPFIENVPPRDTFDAVTVLSMLDYDPYTLRHVVPNIIGLMHHDGMLYIEAPNAGVFPRRNDDGAVPYDIELPMGIDLAGRYAFAIDDLHELADINALTITEEIFHNYSRADPADPRSLLRHPLQALLYGVMKRKRECIGIRCRQNHMLKMFRRTMTERLRRRRIADGKESLEDDDVMVVSTADHC